MWKRFPCHTKKKDCQFHDLEKYILSEEAMSKYDLCTGFAFIDCIWQDPRISLKYSPITVEVDTRNRLQSLHLLDL